MKTMLATVCHDVVSVSGVLVVASSCLRGKFASERIASMAPRLRPSVRASSMRLIWCWLLAHVSGLFWACRWSLLSLSRHVTSCSFPLMQSCSLLELTIFASPWDATIFADCFVCRSNIQGLPGSKGFVPSLLLPTSEASVLFPQASLQTQQKPAFSLPLPGTSGSI